MIHCKSRQYSLTASQKRSSTIATGLWSAALDKVTRPKLMVRPSRTTRASASTSDERDGAHEMSGLIDRRHRPVSAVGGRIAITIDGVGERHQRLAADDAAMPAQPLGEGHAQDRARLPVRRRTGRRGAVDAGDRQPEILYPRCEHIAQDAPCFLDVELLRCRLVLHRWFLARMVGILECIPRKWTRTPRGLKMPDLRPYDKGWGAGPSCSGDWH